MVKAKAKTKAPVKSGTKAKAPKKSGTKEKQIGVVSNYFDHVSVAAIKLEAGLKVGDKIKITGGETDFEQPIKSMQIDRKDITKAKKGDDIGIKVKEKVRKGYKVFKI